MNGCGLESSDRLAQTFLEMHMSYLITCPRCSKEYRVKSEADHSKTSKAHEIVCPDDFFDKIKCLS